MAKKWIFTFLFLLTVCLLFAGCSAFSKTSEDPREVIQDAYGDQQYIIYFNSQGLETPISSLYYTASYIPKLPIPKKVGYVFAGWYFDAEYTQPYEDDYLLIRMRNVTLYARWIEEAIVANGTYAIEFSAAIVPESVKKGRLTDAVGGYDDFSQDIVAEGTFIEKSGSGIRLKLQYRSPYTTGYFDLASAYTVTVAAESSSVAQVTERIEAENSLSRTIFIDISRWKLSDPLYLSVLWTDCNPADGLSNDPDAANYVGATQTEYLVEFRITAFIGYDKPFTEQDPALDDGYYLVRTYMRLTDGGETMAESFNPVFSYIRAEGGHYTLIKPFAAYSLMASNEAGVLSPDDLFSRFINFYMVSGSYTTPIVSESNAPDDKSYYGQFSYEFHPDSGQLYYIADMGDDYRRDLHFDGISTAMECIFGAGQLGISAKRIEIDFEHMLPIAEESMDYIPLEGDYFQYSDEMSLRLHTTDANLMVGMSGSDAYDLMRTYGMNYDLATYFFSSAAQKVNLETISALTYGTRVTYQPVGKVHASDSNLTYRAVYQVYGYDARRQDLCEDSYTFRTFDNTGHRMRKTVRVGKTVAADSEVDLYSLFREKVIPAQTDFTGLEIKAYRMANNKADFTKEVAISSRSIALNEDLAVVYTLNIGEGTLSSLVELRVDQGGAVPTVVEGSFDPAAIYEVGESIAIPRVTYDWFGKHEEYVSNYFPDDPDYVADVCILNMCTLTVDEDTGLYTPHFREPKSSSMEKGNPGMMSVDGTEEYVMYEMVNEYGERDYYVFSLVSAGRPRYEIFDENDGLFIRGNLQFSTQGDGSRVRRAVSANFGTDAADKSLQKKLLHGESDLREVVGKTFRFHLTAEDTWETMVLQSYTIDSATRYFTKSTAGMTTDEIANELLSYLNPGDYAYFSFVYTTAYGDKWTAEALYNVNFLGKDEPLSQIFTNENYFSNTKYVFIAPRVYSSDFTRLSDATITCDVFDRSTEKFVALGGANSTNAKHGTFEAVANTGTVILRQPGRIRVYCRFTLGNDEEGNPVFASRISRRFDFWRELDVLDRNNTEMTITYITDEAHPFNAEIAAQSTSFVEGGKTYYAYKTAPFTLAEGKPITMSVSCFASEGKIGNDWFYTWATKPYASPYDSGRLFYDSYSIDDFVAAFNTANAVLYGLWDEGITVTTRVDGTETDKTVHLQRRTYNMTFEYAATPSPGTIPGGYTVTGYRYIDLSTGISGERTVLSDGINISSVSVQGNTVFEPIFHKLITIVCKTDNPYTPEEESFRNISFRGELFEEGKTFAVLFPEAKLAQMNSVPVNPELRDRIEFKYWAVDVGGTLTRIHLSYSKLDGDWAVESVDQDGYVFTVTLVAVYGPIGE